MNKAIATTQWFLYGRRHFRKAGYERHRLQYDAPVQRRADIGRDEEGADGVDLRGKVVVITGANSGLGKEMTTYAAAKGANVYMICRSKERAEEARDEIVRMTANENVKIILADVSEYSQVKTAAKTLQSAEPKIDCLICNAGALLNEKRLTSEGNESTIASHLIGGSYLLSQLLLPQLKAPAAASTSSDTARTTPSKVIFTTSGGMYLTQFPSWATATSTAPNHTYDGVMAYSYAKRGQVILAEENAKLHPEIQWMSAHPGWTLTAAVEDAFGEEKKYLEPMRDTWEGAEGLTWLMGAGGRQLKNGALYLDREVQVKHMAGPLFSEGRFTKNSEGEVRDFMENLSKASGLE